MNILIAIAGIVFGGGMIGQLIMFFVKRNDEMKAKKNDYLRILLNKISDYGKFINDQMIHSIKYLRADLKSTIVNTELVQNANSDFENQVYVMNLSIEVEKLLGKIITYNGLVNILPEAYIFKHNNITDMLGKLDLETLQILLTKDDEILERYSKINHRLVNQLVLIEKLKLAIAKEIK